MEGNQVAPAAPLPPEIRGILDAMVHRFELEAARVALGLPQARSSFSTEPLVSEFLEDLHRLRPRAAWRFQRRMARPLRAPTRPAEPFGDLDLRHPAALRSVDLAAHYSPGMGSLRRLASLFESAGGEESAPRPPLTRMRLFPTVDMPVMVPPVRGLKVKLLGVRSPQHDPRKLSATAFGFSSDGRMHLSRPLALGLMADEQSGSVHPSRPLQYFVFVPQARQRPEVYTVAINLAAGADWDALRLERRVIKRMLRELRTLLADALGLSLAGPLGPWGRLFGTASATLFDRVLQVMRPWARIEDLGSASLQVTVHDPGAEWLGRPDVISRVGESPAGTGSGVEVSWRAELV